MSLARADVQLPVRQEPSTPLVRVNTQNVDLFTLCQSLAQSGYFKDATDAHKAVVKVLYGQELGIPPVSAMMGVHIIEGKPAPSSNLLACIVKRSGIYTYRVRQNTEAVCELEFFERGESLGIVRWTMQDAVKAKLSGKDVWNKYPRQMLFSRCMSEGVRTHCPDLFGGAPVYTAEELGAEVDGETGEPKLLPTPRAVNTATGEIQERVTDAAEQQGFFNGATVEHANPAALNQQIADLCKELGVKPAEGQKPTDAIRAYCSGAFLEAGLGTIARLSELPIPKRQRLVAILTQATADRSACFAQFKANNPDIADDRKLRLDCWSDLLGRDIETSADISPQEWTKLREIQQPHHQPEPSADDPFQDA